MAIDVSELLHEWRKGSNRALDRLVPLVYEELHGIAKRHMASERPDHTLQTTALLHEACLRLMGADVDWKNRAHFFAVASGAMRRVLVDHARAQRTAKRGGVQVKVPLDDAMATAMRRPWDLLDVEAALQRLHEHDPRKSRVIEMRFFGGLQLSEIAEAVGITRNSVDWDLRLGKAWLRRELRGRDEPTTDSV